MAHRLWVGIAASGFLLAGAALAEADASERPDPVRAPVTVTGHLMDLPCSGKGVASRGALGLLGDDGHAYLLVGLPAEAGFGKAALLRRWGGRRAKVTAWRQDLPGTPVLRVVSAESS